MATSIYNEKSKKTGMTSIILITAHRGKRTKKALGLYFKTNPQTNEERLQKKEKLLIAQKIANAEEKKLLQGQHHIEPEYNPTADFVQYAIDFTNQHAVKDKRKYYGVIKKLQTFMEKKSICCYELSETTLKKFARSLHNELKGESPHNYFSKLKQIITAATDEQLFRTNPSLRVRLKKTSYIQKEVLTMDELKKLYETEIGNVQVRNAFLFASFTGLRWVDIEELRWKNIAETTLKLVQSKTKTVVSIPLHQDAIELIGQRGNSESRVFQLPSHTGALKWLKIWTAKAGISKHITFHCGRHSYGTALITHGVDVSIASKLLGHSSLANTQRYVRISENLKEQAIHKIPSIIA